MMNEKNNASPQGSNSAGGAKPVELSRVLKALGDALLLVVIVFAVFVLIVSIAAKRDEDGTATVFGRQLRFVQSDSMAKCELTDVSGYKIKSIPVKSCVFVEVVPTGEAEAEAWYASIEVGDVITFKYVYTKQETITHRVVDITKKETGGYIFTLEGDNKNSDSKLLKQTIDTSLTDSPNYVVGRVTGQSYLLGLLVYALKMPVGIVCLIIIPCLIIIIFEILRLVRVFGREKREKLIAERDRQESELEELRRRLAQLEGNTEKNESATEASTAAKLSVAAKTSVAAEANDASESSEEEGSNEENTEIIHSEAIK